jgi:hypothetical protein
VVFNSTASPHHSGQHHQRQGNSRNGGVSYDDLKIWGIGINGKLETNL